MWEYRLHEFCSELLLYTYLTPAEDILPGNKYIEVFQHLFQLLLQDIRHHRVAVTLRHMLAQLSNTHLDSTAVGTVLASSPFNPLISCIGIHGVVSLASFVE
jgi:hypothetical protein